MDDPRLFLLRTLLSVILREAKNLSPVIPAAREEDPSVAALPQDDTTGRGVSSFFTRKA